jgi:tRNA-dihydrouridine synthase
MIGRAAVQKPWLFASLKSGAGSGGAERVTPQSSELESKPQPGLRHMPEIDFLAIALRFIELVETLLPSEWQKETCRRVFSYYAENVSFAHHLRFSLINAPSLDVMRQILRDYFDQVPQDRIFVQDKILA